MTYRTHFHLLYLSFWLWNFEYVNDFDNWPHCQKPVWIRRNMFTVFGIRFYLHTWPQMKVERGMIYWQPSSGSLYCNDASLDTNGINLVIWLLILTHISYRVPFLDCVCTTEERIHSKMNSTLRNKAFQRFQITIGMTVWIHTCLHGMTFMFRFNAATFLTDFFQFCVIIYVTSIIRATDFTKLSNILSRDLNDFICDWITCTSGTCCCMAEMSSWQRFGVPQAKETA